MYFWLKVLLGGIKLWTGLIDLPFPIVNFDYAIADGLKVVILPTKLIKQISACTNRGPQPTCPQLADLVTSYPINTSGNVLPVLSSPQNMYITVEGEGGISILYI